MELTAIQPVGALQTPSLTGNTGANVEAPRSDFAQWLGDTLGSADRDLKAADAQVQQLALGGTENLHEVMLSIERARVSLELAVQVRSRLMEAYQDIMKMQV